MSLPARRDKQVALVLAGGGARGAYEVGALSALLPYLEDRGERPTILVGTSVGAINVVQLGASRHLPAGRAADLGLSRWREVERSSVLRPILAHQVPLTVLRYAGGVLSLPGVRLTGLLDPQPLGRNLARWVDWGTLHRNVRRGCVRAVAAVTTEVWSGRTVVFVDGVQPRRGQPSHVVDYVPTRLGVDHVRASAAIPILFPPVRVRSPAGARGWYVDGGVRFNTPIKPALDLGAERLVVVATDAVAAEPRQRRGGPPPDIGDAAFHLLHGTLVDPLIEDLRLLGDVNVHFASSHADTGETALDRYRRERGKRPYRKIPYLLVAPRSRGAIGRLASAVFRERYRGLRGVRSPDLRLLDRLLGGDSATHGELLSYLFFDRDFIEELMAMGRSDAQAVLRAGDRGDGPWRTSPLKAFTRSGAPSTSA